MTIQLYRLRISAELTDRFRWKPAFEQRRQRDEDAQDYYNWVWTLWAYWLWWNVDFWWMVTP